MRILAILPIPYSEEGGFWNRDAGLVVRKLRALGHDASLVALKKPGCEPAPDSPVLVATLEEMTDPAWWQRQNPDAIILNAWAAPRWHELRATVASLKKPLVEKLDTDGVKSPRIWLRNYIDHHASHFLLTDSFFTQAKVISSGIARSLIVRLVPALMDLRMIRTMSLVPVYAAENPVASARVKRFLALFAASPMPRVVTIPHPTNTDCMGFDPAVAKENVLIGVGRWKAANKGWPLFFKTAKKFLRLHPGWRVVAVGDKPSLSSRAQQEIDAFEGRFLIAGNLGHAELSALYKRSRIYLFPSFMESFNIAAAEALCCGCTVVGPGKLSSVNYFVSFRSGTASHVRNADHFLDALEAEVTEWKNGHRDPAAISRTALDIFSVDTVANQFLDLFQNWKDITQSGTPALKR